MLLQGSILQYFWAALSYPLSLRPSFYLFLSGRLRQVWRYIKSDLVMFYWHSVINPFAWILILSPEITCIQQMHVHVYFTLIYSCLCSNLKGKHNYFYWQFWTYEYLRQLSKKNLPINKNNLLPWNTNVTSSPGPQHYSIHISFFYDAKTTIKNIKVPLVPLIIWPLLWGIPRNRCPSNPLFPKTAGRFTLILPCRVKTRFFDICNKKDLSNQTSQ